MKRTGEEAQGDGKVVGGEGGGRGGGGARGQTSAGQRQPGRCLEAGGRELRAHGSAGRKGRGGWAWGSGQVLDHR